MKLQFQAHLNTPWFHSYVNPVNKINRNLPPAVKSTTGLITANFILITSGNNKTISTSKTKNNTAIKKNRDENGSRETPKGSNPHSNGVSFSRFLIVFFEKIKDNIIKVIEIIINIIPKKETKIIIYPF